MTQADDAIESEGIGQNKGDQNNWSLKKITSNRVLI